MMLSIVIPSHSQPELLTACLTSVTTYAPSGTEIIVVDDGSVGACISAVSREFHSVIVIRHIKPQGFCIAANAGVNAAQGDVVELLNDDTEVEPGWAEAALRHFEQPTVVAVAPLVLQLNRQREKSGLSPLIDTAGDDYDEGGFARKRGHGVPWDMASAHLRIAGPVWGVSAAAGFYRRSAFLNAGGFPSHFGAYFEDVDLSHRLRKHGGAIMYEPTSVVRHHLSSSYGKRPTRRSLERQSCNEERVFLRHPRSRSAWLRHAGVLAGKALRRLDEGMFLPWFTGRARAVAEALFCC